MQKTKNKLPDGYSIKTDQDGDWVLIPPEDVTVVSLPGEPYLIGKCSRKTAMSDAIKVIKELEKINGN